MAATWAVKLDQAARDVLDAGEHVLAALFVLPTATSCTASALAARHDGDAIASTMPVTAAVLGLTEHRLLVYGHSSLSDKPEGLKLSLPVGDLRRVEVEQRSATSRFVLRFGDGSRATYEAPSRLNDHEPFVAAAAS